MSCSVQSERSQWSASLGMVFVTTTGDRDGRKSRGRFLWTLKTSRNGSNWAASISTGDLSSIGAGRRPWQVLRGLMDHAPSDPNRHGSELIHTFTPASGKNPQISRSRWDVMECVA